jgi:hypothetical protein
MDKLSSLITKVNDLPSLCHDNIATYLRECRIDMTKNKNGFFVDLCKLNSEQIDHIFQIIEKYDLVNNIEENNDIINETQDVKPDMLFIEVSSRTVMDKINDILKKHIPVNPYADIKKKSSQSYKRTIIVTNRRSDLYEPRLNELQEEI